MNFLHRFLVLTISFSLIWLSSNADTTSILFLGNSYTNYNNLKNLVKDIAIEGGDTLIVDANTPGGYQLQDHAGNATSMAKLKQSWDYVVIQAQSQEAGFSDAYVQANVYPYARQLADTFYKYNPCSEVVFYMTWGRKYGDQSNCGAVPQYCTFSGMTDRLRNGYKYMADDNKALTAPCGISWRNSWFADSTINLWTADNSHPSMAGSYLAAQTIYSTIFEKDPSNYSFTAGLNSTSAQYLRQTAWNTVQDSSKTWNMGVFDKMPKSGFKLNDLSNEPNVQFNLFDSSFNATKVFYVIAVDSNQFDTLYSASGLYEYNGNGCFKLFEITQFVENDCGSSSSSISIYHICSDIEEYLNGSIELFPLPTDSKLYVKLNHPELKIHTISIFDLIGNELDQISIVKNQITHQLDLSSIAKGDYILQFVSDQGTFSKRIIKQ